MPGVSAEKSFDTAAASSKIADFWVAAAHARQRVCILACLRLALRAEFWNA
jgi:hypothetical protein